MYWSQGAGNLLYISRCVNYCADLGWILIDIVFGRNSENVVSTNIGTKRVVEKPSYYELKLHQKNLANIDLVPIECLCTN